MTNLETVEQTNTLDNKDNDTNELKTITIDEKVDQSPEIVSVTKLEPSEIPVFSIKFYDRDITKFVIPIIVVLVIMCFPSEYYHKLFLSIWVLAFFSPFFFGDSLIKKLELKGFSCNY
jgi:hypothetical protein